MTSFYPRAALALALPLFVTLFAFACGGDGGDANGTGTSVRDPGEAVSDRPALTIEQMTELARTEIEGYEAGDPVVGGGSPNVSVTYEPRENGNGVTAVVTLATCNPFLCWDLDGDISSEHEQNLRSAIAPIHLDNPNLVFEYGPVQAAPGYDAFFAYFRSFVHQENTTATTNSYRMIYHDDANMISIMVTPAGPIPASELELEMELDQSKGELTAKKFFAAYAQAFQPAD